MIDIVEVVRCLGSTPGTLTAEGEMERPMVDVEDAG